MPVPATAALRLMEMHGTRFNMPIITFIDTPGAYRRGRGRAWSSRSHRPATCVRCLGSNVPVICTVIGEGAPAAHWRLAWVINMLQYSTYSVISRKVAPLFLWKSADKAPLAAEAMGIIAPRSKEASFTGFHSEPLGGAHRIRKRWRHAKAQLLAI